MSDDTISLCFIFFVILVVTSTCNYQVNNGNILETKRESVKVRAGLQECQTIGSNTIVWQKECLVPKNKQ